MARLIDPDAEQNPYAPPTAGAEAPARRSEDDGLMLTAKRSSRWWARVVDSLLLAVTFVPSIFLIDFGERSSATGDGRPWALMFLLPLGLLCYQWYLITTRGQSLGKRWSGIKIVTLSGEPPGFLRGVLLREWVVFGAQAIPVVGRLLGIVDAVAIFGQEHRCLHDYLAGTKVVLALPKWSAEPPAPGA